MKQAGKERQLTEEEARNLIGLFQDMEWYREQIEQLKGQMSKCQGAKLSALKNGISSIEEELKGAALLVEGLCQEYGRENIEALRELSKALPYQNMLSAAQA